jgi:hypothetical protein
MTRDIRSYDSETDIRNAWKVRAARASGRRAGGGARGLRRPPGHGSGQARRPAPAPQPHPHTHTLAKHPATHLICPPLPPPASQVFDKEGRGWISAAELRHVLTSIGEKLAPDEMDAMMAESDPDQDGKIQ